MDHKSESRWTWAYLAFPLQNCPTDPSLLYMFLKLSTCMQIEVLLKRNHICSILAHQLKVNYRTCMDAVHEHILCVVYLGVRAGRVRVPKMIVTTTID